MSVRHNAARHRYELDTDNGVALAVYHEQGDRLVFTHTEVPPVDEGKGYASRLVKEALTDAHRRGFKTRSSTTASRQEVARTARKAATHAVAVIAVPQARSMKVKDAGQPRSVARLVKS